MAGENENESQEDQGNVEGGDTPGTNDGSASGDPGTGEGASGTGDVVTRAEFDALMQRMQGADRAKAAAEAKLRDIERKDQSELEKATTDLAESQKEIERLTDILNRKTLENAFLTYGKYTWHDAGDAMRLLDMEGVELKDGSVTGLEPAIDKLAKAKPHLIKKDDEGSGNGSHEASGSASNGRRKGEGRDDKKDYSSRFPALKR
jgi:hypothetical protein